ncbi:MAG: sigma-54-dependent Fis family transcriptional regulator, partial [Methylocystaceae bacterium]|nr:sigma-54-dependent Fis family transcriptional regulator [Methylocystaceae bacterium]
HALSPREDKPFIAINCGAIPRDLMESELFGSEKGAYTGSVRTRAGLVENANGGTLFLDEIGDMPLDMQVKLLRLLEDRKFTRVGGSQVLSADFRLVCATHQDLPKLVATGQFREDLYYRINVFPITLAGLDDRRPDIERLSGHILRMLQNTGGFRVPKLQPSAITKLQEASWPGNIRQLRNVLERASVLYASQTIGADEIARIVTTKPVIERKVETQALLASLQDLNFAEEERPAIEIVTPAEEEAAHSEIARILQQTTSFNLRDHMNQIEADFIKEALLQTDQSVSATARLLGLQRTTLIEKMRKLGIQKDDA